MKFIDNIPADMFSISAVAIALILADDNSPAEQNAIGNWFMLVGQYLATNASQQQVVNNANNTSNTSNQHIVNSGNPIEMMEKIRNAFDTEINHLKQ